MVKRSSLTKAERRAKNDRNAAANRTISVEAPKAPEPSPKAESPRQEPPEAMEVSEPYPLEEDLDERVVEARISASFFQKGFCFLETKAGESVFVTANNLRVALDGVPASPWHTFRCRVVPNEGRLKATSILSFSDDR